MRTIIRRGLLAATALVAIAGAAGVVAQPKSMTLGTASVGGVTLARVSRTMTALLSSICAHGRSRLGSCQSALALGRRAAERDGVRRQSGDGGWAQGSQRLCWAG